MSVSLALALAPAAAPSPTDVWTRVAGRRGSAVGVRVNAAGPPPGDVELAALVVRAQQGDHAAFATWVRAVTPMLFRLAVRLTGDPARADDVVQDTVVRAWQGLSSMRDPQASRAWACRILKNASIDVARQRVRRRETTIEGCAEDGTHPVAAQLVASTPGADDVLASAQARAFVRALLEQLPAPHRLVLQLHDLDGLTHDEVAAALDVPAGTVASRLSRAREKLERKVKSYASPRRWRWL